MQELEGQQEALMYWPPHPSDSSQRGQSFTTRKGLIITVLDAEEEPHHVEIREPGDPPLLDRVLPIRFASPPSQSGLHDHFR